MPAAEEERPLVLETDRLRLVPLQASHTAELARVYADPGVARHIGGERLSIEGTREQVSVFEQVWRERGYGQSAVIEKASGRMIGRVGLHYWSGWEEVELGYVLAREWQGRGLAREAAQAWVKWAFEHLSADHLIAVIHPENASSIRLARRVGFVFDREDETPRGVEVSVYRLDRAGRETEPTSTIARAAGPESDADRQLATQLRAGYDLREVGVRHLDTAVNDVVAVTSAQGDFALKLYHRDRTVEAVRWEVDLLAHLRRRGAPVVQPVVSRTGGCLEQLVVGGQERLAVLYEWCPGTKPDPGRGTYLLLGEAAARIHRAAEGFPPSAVREHYDAAALVDEQLWRMRPLLVRAGRWAAAAALGERLRARLTEPGLDRGICHMDLTLDNVHVGQTLTVFDFDSAGTCWRAAEPWGVLRFSSGYFQDWLTGYRTARPFGAADEAAVAAFGIIGDLRVVAWKLGVATSSRGTPLLTVGELPAVVDQWLRWEAAHPPA